MLSSQANTEALDPVFLLGADSVSSARSVLSSHVLSEAFLSWEHGLPEPLSVTMEPQRLNVPGEPVEMHRQ